MNVLITVPRLGLPGGVANFYRVLRSHLSEDMVYFEIGPTPGESGSFRAIVRLVSDWWRFHRALRMRRHDLVHVNPSLVPRALLRDGILILISKLHKCPTMVFIHGWDPACESAIRNRYRRVFRYVYNKADALVVLADEFRRLFEDLKFRRPVFVETTLVDDQLFEMQRISPADNLTSSVVNLLYLSRLEKGKGLIEAIEAFALIRHRHPEVRLTVAGSGTERSVAEAFVTEKAIPDVSFLGHIEGPEKDQVFRGADIYLFPTYYAEGMPTTVLEAMAFGLPVVTRPVGGLRDFFEDGQMGYWTESRDPAAIARVLEPLITDPVLRRTMGAYNRRYAQERFAASKVAERLCRLYEMAAASPTGNLG